MPVSTWRRRRDGFFHFGRPRLRGTMRDLFGDYLTLLTLIALIVISVWLIGQGVQFGWVGAILFGAAGLYWARVTYRETLRLHRHRQWREQSKAEMARLLKTAAAFEFEDDIEFWKECLIDADTPWVVFENGTCVLCEDDQDPKMDALEALKKYASDEPYGGDFGVRLLPGMGAWLISYPCGRVLNYFEADAGASDTAAGLIARTIRDKDARSLNIIHVSNKA